MDPDEAPPAYTVLFTGDAKADVSSLDGSIKKRLRAVLQKKLTVAPAEYGSPLGGNLVGFWFHHFASHRVIYRIYADRRLVVVCAVDLRQGVHKSDVYRLLGPIVKSGRLAEQIREVLEGLGAFESPSPPSR